MIAGKFNSLYAKEHKLNNYSRKNKTKKKKKKIEMNRSKQINKTNTKDKLFSENFTIEELEDAINKT
jgi:hypothetical protein